MWRRTLPRAKSANTSNGLMKLTFRPSTKDTPEQLKPIWEKADRREHPTRSVTVYADITLDTLHPKAIEAEVEAKRKATSSEVVKATEPSKGANN